MKRFLSALLCFALVVTMFMSTALAAEKQPTRYEMYRLEAMVITANCQISAMVRTAQLTPWNDVRWLKRSTEATANSVKRYAASIGAEVECEYTSYWVDGQYVDIDPLRVVHRKHY